MEHSKYLLTISACIRRTGSYTCRQSLILTAHPPSASCPPHPCGRYSDFPSKSKWDLGNRDHTTECDIFQYGRENPDLKKYICGKKSASPPIRSAADRIKSCTAFRASERESPAQRYRLGKSSIPRLRVLACSKRRYHANLKSNFCLTLFRGSSPSRTRSRGSRIWNPFSEGEEEDDKKDRSGKDKSGFKRMDGCGWLSHTNRMSY